MGGKKAQWCHLGIERPDKPDLLHCWVYGAWCYFSKTYTTSEFPTFVFPVERLLLLQAYWKLSFFRICVGGECSAHDDDGFSAMSFFLRSVWSTLLNLSMNYLSLKMLFVSLWYFSTYILSVFGLKKLHITHCIQLFVPLFFQICNAPLSCLLVRNLSQVSSFLSGDGCVFVCVRACVYVCAQASCLCFLTVLLCVSPHS